MTSNAESFDLLNFRDSIDVDGIEPKQISPQSSVSMSILADDETIASSFA
jgi:hypothetical protein